MSLYSIESEKVSEMSHTGEVTIDGERAIELSDEEVDILVRLIREKDTTDVHEQDLENLYPDLYEKLREAYHNLAYETEELHWLWEGYHSSYFDYDEDELMQYCENNLGFSFEFKPEEHLSEYEMEEYEEDPDLFENTIDEAKSEAFQEWLDEYINGLSNADAASFFYDHMNADLDMESVDYTVEIPQDIIKKAKEQ